MTHPHCGSLSETNHTRKLLFTRLRPQPSCHFPKAKAYPLVIPLAAISSPVLPQPSDTDKIPYLRRRPSANHIYPITANMLTA
jgi:hypothetical protein